MESGGRLARPLQEVAQGFSVSVDTLRRAVRRRELKAIRIGKRVLIPEDEIERLSRDGLGFRSKAQKPK